MKIAYSHLVQCILENPSIEQVSNSLFQLGHEHEIEGNIFDMEFTPNRGDCLSVTGLLRDLAVFYTINLNQKIYTEKLDELLMDFENLSENICPQISFLKLEIDQIPEIYKYSLGNYFSDLGLNKNNFFTDVSNYLSYELGQPTHCYDASKINNKLVFHEIEGDEEFETLLDKKITLTGKNAVFSLNNEVINLAGVVGNKRTSCSTGTKTVIVECAFFQPEAIIGKSIKYDIQSEASHKFERGVDPECHERVLRRFISIVGEHANILDMSITSHKYIDNPSHLIPVNAHRINQIIGINISDDECLNYLLKLGFDIKKAVLKVPSFRSDIKTHNDLAEEVARVIGYDNLPVKNINIPNKNVSKIVDVENNLKSLLVDNGFYEVINAPFIANKEGVNIKVDNPLDSNREFLRTNISDSLIENLLYNERRQKDVVKIFEISDLYYFKDGLQKKRKIAILASGRVGNNFNDFSKKINKDYIVNFLKNYIHIDDIIFNEISRSDIGSKSKNTIISLELEIKDIKETIFEYRLTSEPQKNFVEYSPISDFPSTSRDISYAISDYSKSQELQNLILGFKSNHLKKIFIFDYFENKKLSIIKIGFRFIFQSNDKTLTDKEVDAIINNITEYSSKIKGVEIPGLT